MEHLQSVHTHLLGTWSQIKILHLSIPSVSRNANNYTNLNLFASAPHQRQFQPSISPIHMQTPPRSTLCSALKWMTNMPILAVEPWVTNRQWHQPEVLVIFKNLLQRCVTQVELYDLSREHHKTAGVNTFWSSIAFLHAANSSGDPSSKNLLRNKTSTQ